MTKNDYLFQAKVYGGLALALVYGGVWAQTQMGPGQLLADWAGVLSIPLFVAHALGVVLWIAALAQFAHSRGQSGLWGWLGVLMVWPLFGWGALPILLLLPDQLPHSMDVWMKERDRQAIHPQAVIVLSSSDDVQRFNDEYVDPWADRTDAPRKTRRQPQVPVQASSKHRW